MAANFSLKSSMLSSRFSLKGEGGGKTTDDSLRNDHISKQELLCSNTESISLLFCDLPITYFHLRIFT